MKSNKFFAILASIIFTLFITQPVFAHVVVKPAETNVATFQTFTVGVPNEKDNPVVGLKLTIPKGLKHVSPNVKPGWTINVETSDEGEDTIVKEITWTAGSIPSGQRDDFLFSAQVPSDTTTLIWKAQQTYQDGTVMSWDMNPKGNHDDMEMENMGPYSTTTVIDDLSNKREINNETKSNTSTTLSIVAIALAAAAITMQLRRK